MPPTLAKNQDKGRGPAEGQLNSFYNGFIFLEIEFFLSENQHNRNQLGVPVRAIESFAFFSFFNLRRNSFCLP